MMILNDEQFASASVFYDIIIADDAGTPLCTLEGLEVAKHQFNPPPEDLIPYDVGLQRSVLPLLSDTRDKVNGHKLDQFNGNAASTKVRTLRDLYISALSFAAAARGSMRRCRD